MFDLVIQNARILDPKNGRDETGDIGVTDGKVSAIDQPNTLSDSKVKIDGKGKWVLPGLVDVHTHLREPGETHKETIQTGARAAVVGGFTTIACMANTKPVNDCASITKMIQEKAKSADCKVKVIGAVTKGLQGKELADIGSMATEGVIAISDDGMPVMNSKLMRQAMEYAKAFNIPVVSHAEDLHLSAGCPMNEGETSFNLGLKGNPSASEEIMVAREIALSRLTGCHVHIAHVSTGLAVSHIRRAKEEGLPVTAEVTPHHLVLTDGEVAPYNTHCKMAPPLRSQADVEALQNGLKDGTIDIIATDHAPHSSLEKNKSFSEAANGVIGLETVIPTLLELSEDRFGLSRFLEALTIKPSEIFGLDSGTLTIGAAADITVVDPDQEWTVRKDDLGSLSSNSPFLGKKYRGRVEMTLVNGNTVYDK